MSDVTTSRAGCHVSVAQLSIAIEELGLLRLVTQPSGKIIEQLAQQMIKYGRVQVRGAEAFALDPTKLESL